MFIWTWKCAVRYLENGSGGVQLCRLLHAGAVLLKADPVSLDSPAFQRPLKQLLLRVHPDRVARHPQAQRANEASFKVLSSYLDELRGDGGSPAGQYHLDFYVERTRSKTTASSSSQSTPSQRSGSENTGLEQIPAWQDLTVNESKLAASAKLAQDPRYWTPGQEELNEGFQVQGQSRTSAAVSSGQYTATGGECVGEEVSLHRVTVRLPPPPPRSAARLPRAVRRAFSRLFEALGLNNPFGDDESHDVDRTKAEVTGKHLTTFLPDAIELARQGEAVHHSMPSQQLQSMTSAFWLARKLRIVLEDSVKALPPQARVGLLETLARALDASRNEALSKCTIVLGEGAGMDVLGRVWLPYDLPREIWSDTLAAIDVATVWQRQQHFESVRRHEAVAAKAFGVDAVFTTSHLSLSDSYLRFLEALGTFGSSKDGYSLFRGLSICALPATDINQPWLSHDTGVATVSVTERPEVLQKLLEEGGLAVTNKLEKSRIAQVGLKDLGKRVELRLRLRQLMRSTELSSDQFEKGCYRLLEHDKALRKYVEGSILRLSDRNVIRPGQQVISVAWDFEM